MGNTATTSTQEEWAREHLKACSSAGTDGEETVATASSASSDKFDLLESLVNYDVEIARARSKLEEIHSQRCMELSQFLVDKAELERAKQQCENRYWTVLENIKPRLSTAPQIYLEHIKRARRENDSIQSSYVMSLEAKLCRASHVLGAFLYQSSLIKSQFEELLGFIKSTTVRETEAASSMEMNVLNDICAIAVEIKLMKERYISTTEQQRVETTRLSLHIAIREEEEQKSLQTDNIEFTESSVSLAKTSVPADDNDSESSMPRLDLFLDTSTSPRSVTAVTTALRNPSEPIKLLNECPPSLVHVNEFV